MPSLLQKPSDHRLAPAVWPFLLIVLLLTGIGILSVQVVSWTRAYMEGVTTWVAAEHEAVAQLRGYAVTGDERYLQRFRRELAKNLACRDARLELEKPDPDLDVAFRHFRNAQLPERDIAGMIRMFRLFKAHPLLGRALDLWRQTDPLLDELVAVSETMRAEHASGRSDRPRLLALSGRADTLHERLQPRAAEFGRVLGDAARQIVSLVLIVLPLVAGALVVLGLAIFTALGRRAARATDALQALAERFEHQATHDALTGLVNRPRFEALLAAALREQRASGGETALLYFDLDQFKVVNDTCGHAAGDELLKQVSWRVQRMAEDGATLGRLGGDEFGLLVPGCGPDKAMALARRICEQLAAQRFYWAGKAFAVGASIGVLQLGEGLNSVAEALAAADHACYLAKDAGRNRVQQYRPDDREVQQRRGEMHWVERLQAALDGDGFELVAQEIRPVAWPGRAGEGLARQHFELLLRLRDGEGELVAPMAFIPAAERYGLMPRIDRWVIARACRELARLRHRHQQLPVCMVNISGASASDPALADYIARCLRESGLDGSCLGVELTETVAVSNLTACSELMGRLRSLGCLIALDDFGTGMSSFSYLRNLPIDLLKIDRAFIRNVADDAIDHALVETIQRIAAIMGVRTVAEGVEDGEVLSQLALIGVDFVQGTYVQGPVTLAQMMDPARAASPMPITDAASLPLASS